MIAEQLLTTVSISEKALREDVRRRLIDVLTSKDMNDPFEWYNPKVIR
jgi:thioredoxin-like negative regulator of GroEL